MTISNRARATAAAQRRREAMIIGQAILDLQNNSDNSKETQFIGQQLRRAALCFEWSSASSDADERKYQLDNAAEAMRLATLYLNRIVGWEN